jgi:hypothetical protein
MYRGIRGTNISRTLFEVAPSNWNNGVRAKGVLCDTLTTTQVRVDTFLNDSNKEAIQKTYHISNVKQRLAVCQTDKP